MSDGTYTAADIRILSPEDAVERSDFARAEAWSIQYGVSPDWLQRALEACRRAGADPEYLRQRYLLPNGRETAPVNPLVDEAMKEVLREQRESRERWGK
jgi:hypothetical protein